jgi:quercetin dioxygenase-like cupin family protein
VIHRHATDDVVETAALYVLGALPDEERAAFERHLLEGCGACQREVASLEPVVAALGEVAPTVVPPPAVRARLLARLASPWILVRADEVGWARNGLGLQTRPLYREASEGRATALVRLMPGARLPHPPAAATLELYLVRGDLTVEPERLGAGDYCAVTAAALEREPVSEDGCFVVLATSEQDAALAHPAAAPEWRAGVAVVRARQGERRGGDGSGVVTRQLSHDPAHGRFTAHVRMGAGARLPAHRHLTAEQLYVLAGDAHVDGQRLGPGDYYRTAAGTSHDVTYTDRGCEFLVIASAIELLG